MAATLWSHESALRKAGVDVERVPRGDGARPVAEDVRRRSEAISRPIDLSTTIGVFRKADEMPGLVTARLPNAAQPR